MKKVLVINYSQTGQLSSILDRFSEGLDGVEIDRVIVSLKESFDFPWSSDSFFDAFPESVLEVETELAPMEFKYESYDLVVFGYQPWYLSPSIPATSIMKHPDFKSRIKSTPVLSIIGARNMWINSQDRVKHYIAEAGGQLVGNIPLIDRSNNLLSAMSILHWMLTGQKTRKWGLLPLPGINEEDIEDVAAYGVVVNEVLISGNLETLQKQILERGKVVMNTNILFIEGRAKKLFKIWAGIIKKNGTTVEKRRGWLKVFKYYLIFALFLVSPVVLFVYNLLIVPFTQGKIKKKKEYYSGVR
ncbi:MAG: hypothetical protein OCD76_03690 [Reichenbachiella sp.]